MNTFKQVIKIIEDSLNDNPLIKKDTNLRTDLDVDSFDVLMIINALEDEFSISIEEDDFNLISTPEEIYLLLQEKYGIK